MTKSRQSAIKLRLSRLALCLVAIGCIKLCLMGLAAFDFPSFPQVEDKKAAPVADNGDVQAKLDELAAKMKIDEPQKEPEVKKNDEPLPQGALAAQLAAAAKPRRSNDNGSQSVLPAPLVPAGPANAISHAGPTITGILPPVPMPLGTPLVEAGIPAPQSGSPAARAARDESSLWDMLKLTSLPIPGLGSAQAAHAAALDMPAPPPLPQSSPFTPAEQLAPMGQQGVTLPGAPNIPPTIPSGDAPLPQRAPASMPGSAVSPSPLTTAPAPNVDTIPPSFDPNAQNSELARQQQDILMLRRQMDERLKDIKAAEDKMKDLLREANELEEKKVKNLIQMYANMKPRMAAQAMENMDERIAVRILSGMPPKQSGEILTYTNPAKTAKLTELITRMRMGQ
ncbi:MAG: hypothetical protein K1W05_07420 [Desulfovibrio sp.]